MPDSFSELQIALIDVISGLKSVSIDILKKSDIYLQKVGCLDLNSAEPVTQSIIMLVERMSINLTQFGVVLDDAFNSYKKIQGSEEPFVSSEVETGIEPCSTNKCLTEMDTEDEISVEPVTVPTEALIKEEDCHGEIECDEPTLQSVDFPVVSTFEDNAEDEEYLPGETKNGSKNFETRDRIIVELEKDEQFEDNENEVDKNIDIEDYKHLIPLKSKQRYKSVYKVFVKWLKTKNEVISEKSLLSYFLVRSRTLKAPTSLWPEYSMLRSTIKMHHGIDISNFDKVQAFLKKKNMGYIPKKSKTFTKEEIDKFLKEAPDDLYLVMKVVMIMGIAGACRRMELAQITRDCVDDCGTVIFITVPGRRTSITRTFTITNRFSEKNSYVGIFRKYLNRLPPHLSSQRLILNFHNGKSSIQGLGVHKIGKIPARIAKFLRLPDPDSYTLLAFRRSANLLAKAGADIISVMNGGLSYSTVPDNFVWYSKEDTDPLAISSTSAFSGGPTG